MPGTGEKPRWTIEDENGNTLNNNPSREELKGLKEGRYKKHYNDAYACDRCGKSFKELGSMHPHKEYDEKGYWTGRWDCPRCREKYDPGSHSNMRKSLRNCRTGNQNPNHESSKGDDCIELSCIMYGYVDLNKKYDNYTTGVDCQDPVTELLYQIRGKRYNNMNGRWDSGSLGREWYKDYEGMVYFCLSKDGKMVERIYRIPSLEIKKRKGISIYKIHRSHMKNSKNLYWYEKYRVDDEEELKRANDIWQKIIEEENGGI